MECIHRWKTFRAGRARQVSIASAADIENLCTLDRKRWMAMSCPVEGLRFDSRMLAMLDADGDGRIRMDEVLGAIYFLKEQNFDLGLLFTRDPDDEKKLADVMARQAALDKEPPTEEEARLVDEWTQLGKTPAVSFLSDSTEEAEAALAAVEPLIEGFFAPGSDLQLVTEESSRELSIVDHINPRYLEAMMTFSAKCVKPVLGEVTSLDMLQWNRIKNAFAPYRKWRSSRPVTAAAAKSVLEKEEKVLRYKMNLLEFLENFVNMRRLYFDADGSMFQCGVLRMDAREMSLCFPVAQEAPHAALAQKSKCCIIYLQVTRKTDGVKRNVCAVVTAGRTGTLYVGRNGVFHDENGRDCDAVITKIVEASVSLAEAFWLPWRKLGEGVSAAVKKFIGDKQAKPPLDVQQLKAPAPAAGGGVAMASGVAAIGIGIGMVGTAAAAIINAVAGIEPWWMIFPAVAAVILVVSLPSVVLVWLKLRKRDIGAVLNASGWAVNRPMYFSTRRAKGFTKCV